MSEDVTHHHCNKIRRVAEEEKARAIISHFGGGIRRLRVSNLGVGTIIEILCNGQVEEENMAEVKMDQEIGTMEELLLKSFVFSFFFF